MRYRFTCLTPVLTGDGRKLSPIDYMVWKDHVNVLDQKRIFRLLAKGPRLDNYLSQLKKAEKLDFASWGGFAQNFAGRRIPFEHPSCAQHWQRARTDNLHIPTFAAGPGGPYLPATALKGALRTAWFFHRIGQEQFSRLTAGLSPDKPRRLGASAEDRVLGTGASDPMRLIQISDSETVSPSQLQIYLLRVASLKARGKDGFVLGWKQSPAVAPDAAKPEEGAPGFAEMAAPGTVFEGRWSERSYLTHPEIREVLRWKEEPSRSAFFEAANRYSQTVLQSHERFAELAGLSTLQQDIQRLLARLEEVRSSGAGCLLPVGWGGGFLARVGWLETGDPGFRQLLAQTRLYGRGPAPGFPFPKTRRIVFLQDKPACLPGWGLLEVLD
ncbi:MAG: type III-A CRISPR-associated RAMP protein Csm5 [Bryobacteraceae bacterium]